MANVEQTTQFVAENGVGGADLTLTIFDGTQQPKTVRLLDLHRSVITFGRDRNCDIVLSSPFVSHMHGRFCFNGGGWLVEDNGSLNGTLLNMQRIRVKQLCDGDAINVFDTADNKQGVLMVCSATDGVSWQREQLQAGAPLIVGRDQNCGICLPHVSVSRQHASFVFDGKRCWVQDMNSTNGTFVVGRGYVRGQVLLREKDVVLIANTKLIFCNGTISYCTRRNGIRLEAQHIVKQVTKKKKVICNDVSLTIKPCEMVAIIGGSGAGKSTIMNCISGYSIPTQGQVTVNGVDLYQNYNSVKNIIGYVPQQDIVYDGLTVESMLKYTAKLRLPSDTTDAEMNQIIDRVLDMVDLTERRDTLIKSLSGGQRKRASIAVELISDPKLFFLDEPASGLDPGTERNLMKTLKKMAAGGKTVIMVTHSTLNLKMFDKIVFMGKGGNLCFYGSHDEACAFFGVDDIVDVYDMITDQAEAWKRKYEYQSGRQYSVPPAQSQGQIEQKGGERSGFSQLLVLCKRYIHLIVNDHARLILMLGLAPVLTLLIGMVDRENHYSFEQFEMTQAVLFSLACASYFIGTLNSIQEVCKERNILRREYMTGLRIRAYVASKVIVLALVCLIQSLLSTGLFFILIGSPEKSLILPPFFECLLTVFLTSWAASVVGIFVSSLVKNADRAMTIAPLLLMPQLLFAGVIFDLKGVTEGISWFAACRWSMEALGSSVDLNSMESRLHIPFDPKDLYDATEWHVARCWIILFAFVAISSILAGVMLTRLKSERK